MNRVAEPLADTLRRRIAYDGTRTPVKTALFLLVCLAWLLPGLVGHDPWKTDEALAMGAVSGMLRSGDWAVPFIAGEPYTPMVAGFAAGGVVALRAEPEHSMGRRVIAALLVTVYIYLLLRLALLPGVIVAWGRSSKQRVWPLTPLNR